MTGDPREAARILSAGPEEREEMRRNDHEVAQQEMTDLEAQLRGADLRTPEALRLMKKLKAAAGRAHASRNMNAWVWSKGIGR